MIHQSTLAILFSVQLLAQGGVSTNKVAVPQVPTTNAASVNPLLDHDLLDPAYFEIDGRLMRENKLADYFWAKTGLNFKGRTLRVTWEAPHLMVPTSDKLDLSVADRLTKTLPQEISKAMAASLWPAAKVSSTDGDLILTGRIVSVLARSGVMSMAREILTFDIKIIDSTSREVVLACHHRFVCHPYTLGGKGKDIELKVPQFALDFSEFCLANYTK